MTKKGGRPGYRKPDAKRDRISFKLSTHQLQLINRHKFEGEKFSELLNRLLERLADVFEYEPTPKRMEVDLSPRINPGQHLRLTPKASALVSNNFTTPQETIDYLFSLAVCLPTVQPIHTAEDAIVLLSDFAGHRVGVDQVLDSLMTKCSRAIALQLLDVLIDTGKVSAIDIQGRSPLKRIELPSGRRLAWVELTRTRSSSV